MNNISPEFPTTPSTPISSSTANRIWAGIGLAMVILLIAIAIFPEPPPPSIITIDAFVSHIQEGSVRSIVVRGGTDVFIRLNNNEVLTFYKARESNLIELLQTWGITNAQFQAIEYLEQASPSPAIPLFRFIIAIVPATIIIRLLWRMRHEAQRAQSPSA